MFKRLQQVAAIAALGTASFASAAPIDLRTWSAESYPSVATFNPGTWTTSVNGLSVTQSVNGQPTLFFGDFNAFGTKVTGKVRSTNVDDDFLGFVIGYNAGDVSNSSANYLLVDWKAGTQTFDFGAPSSTPGGPANIGLAVSRVTGIPTADEFWQHVDYASNAGGGLQELQRGATLGSTGWAANRDYLFTFDFGPNNLLVTVDGVDQLNITGNFNNGRIGFYNFSQPAVTYSAFDVVPGSFQPPTGAIPEPATWAMMLIGFGAVGGMLRRRNRNLGGSMGNGHLRTVLS